MDIGLINNLGGVQPKVDPNKGLVKFIGWYWNYKENSLSNSHYSSQEIDLLLLVNGD